MKSVMVSKQRKESYFLLSYSYIIVVSTSVTKYENLLGLVLTFTETGKAKSSFEYDSWIYMSHLLNCEQG